MAHVPSHERRLQLIEAAARVINRDGVSGATTRAIAREAGTAQATLHYIFGSKEELFLELLRWSNTVTDEFVDETLIPPHSGVVEAVTYLLTSYYALDRTIVSAQYELLMWSRRTEVAASAAPELYERLISQIASSLDKTATDDEQDIDSGFLAKLVLIAWDGILFGKLCAGDDYVNAHEISEIAKGIVRTANLHVV